MPSLTPQEQQRDLQLEGARFTFVDDDDKTFFVIQRDGTVYPVELVLDGKIVSRLSMSDPVTRTTVPAVLIGIEKDYLFVGRGEDVDMAAAPATAVAPVDTMDLDDDEVVRLSFCDAMPAYGPISDMAFGLARNGDRVVPELIAANGSGELGGFHLFQRDMPTRSKRKLHAIGGGRGMWSLPVRQPVKVSGGTFERPANPFHAENDSVIISTDANPAPGLSRVSVDLWVRECRYCDAVLTLGYHYNHSNTWDDPRRAPFFPGTAILHILFNVTNVIRVLEPDGSERQSIEDLDGNAPRPKIKSCSICDPFVLIIREDDSIGLFIGEIERGKIRRKDMSPMGEKVLLRSGQLAIYEAVAAAPPTEPLPSTRSLTLLVKFVKVMSKAFDIQHTEEEQKSVLAEQKRISRLLLPFVTSPAPGQTYSGVFFTGDRPSWILSTDKGGVRVFPSGHNVVHAFTTSSLWESGGEFLLYSEEGPSLVEWMPDIQLDGHLPARSVPRSRPYSNVVYDASTSLIVAASSFQNRFASYDEDGNIVWEPDSPNISFPRYGWITMDGYEFAPNEFVNCIVSVPLETMSTESGMKDFIAVGTTINRGEDLAVKGAVYVFEIVEVVPDPSTSIKRWWRLKLLCRDDAKGPVSFLCGMNGYLVSSMGQKIFVRAFDLDERLVGVAFLDVGVYVTSLRAVKNLLVIGDAVKSVWFVAFQTLTTAASPELTCSLPTLSIVTCDEEGIVRMYAYDPHADECGLMTEVDPESKSGQHLLRRTEFHGQTEYRSSLLVARRPKTGDPEIPQARLVCGR
ncbi:hypothetical protein BV20DRAFT_1115505 [Pilatotrama ljubarskyi]|nr:hypothetical protein BV20DRAFT_1115505 [Pilatotrama ljubarskyi]